MVLGLADPSELRRLGELAESVAQDLERQLRLPSDGSLLPLPITLYWFGQRFDYSEFVTMVENRPAPPELEGHWNFSVLDAYACLSPSADEGEALRSLLAEQLAGLLLDGSTTVPRWFSRGFARALAAEVAPRAPRVKSWQDRADASWSEFVRNRDQAEAGGFPSGGIDRAATAALEFAFAADLLNDERRFRRLLETLRGGASFDDAFRAVYRRTAEDLARSWNRR